MPPRSVIGIDLGATKIAAARFAAGDMSIQEEMRAATPREGGFPAVLKEIFSLIHAMRTDDTAAIGIGVPGLVSHETGTLLNAPNIPDSANVPLRSLLVKETGLPVTVENDAQCFAFAEATLGAGKGHAVVVGVTLGTGVGGGIVLHGALFRGAHGHSGEIGHMLLQPGQPPYETQDARGEVEQFISGTAMRLRCQEAKKPEDYLDGEVCAFLRPDIFRETAWMCVSLSALLDPSMIVFGGSTGMALKPHLPAIATQWKQWAVPGMTEPAFAVASLPDAAVRGAAALAL